MRIRWSFGFAFIMTWVVLGAWEARAQGAQGGEYRWVADVGIGIDTPINGNVNSGAIGFLQGQAAAILPNSYGDVYGTGLQFRFGGGYVLDDFSELRGVFIYQSADADLVRLGDIGPSSLYAQYDDYKSLALDFGYRRYIPIGRQDLRVYGEATLGMAFIDEIDVLFAAPQSNIVFDQTAGWPTWISWLVAASKRSTTIPLG
jgi:hypothetical protein